MDEFKEKSPYPGWLAPNRIASLPDAEGIAHFLDQLVARIGRVTTWLTLILVLLVAADVLFRYIWHVSSVAAQEFEWHLLAVMALIGASYTLQQGDHVRVDIFYERYPNRLKLWINTLTAGLIIIPTMAFIAWMSLSFVSMSWEVNEGSPDPGGLPALYLIKLFVPLGFLLVTVQGIAMTIYGLNHLKSDTES